MFRLFAPFRPFDVFRAPNLSDPLLTRVIELRDSAGVYLLDAGGKQLTVTA